MHPNHGVKKPTTLIKNNFGGALQAARNLTCVTQEKFDEVSSRTYVSSLERGLKSPTIQKVDSLASVLGIHPLTLLTLAYCEHPVEEDVKKLRHVIERELSQIMNTEVAK